MNKSIKKWLLLGGIALIPSLFTPVYAANNFIPDCPKIQDIQSGGVSQNVIPLPHKLYILGRRAEAYGTDRMWTYVMFVTADSSTEAYNSAVTDLPSLRYKSGAWPWLGHWACYYRTANYRAIAITDPVAMESVTLDQASAH